MGAWAAFVDGRPVGIERAIRTAADTEVAFGVVDAEQGRGSGSALLESVTTVACAGGAWWVEAVTDPGNRATLACSDSWATLSASRTGSWRDVAGCACSPGPGSTGASSSRSGPG